MPFYDVRDATDQSENLTILGWYSWQALSDVLIGCYWQETLEILKIPYSVANRYIEKTHSATKKILRLLIGRSLSHLFFLDYSTITTGAVTDF